MHRSIVFPSTGKGRQVLADLLTVKRILLLALAYFTTGWLGLRVPYAESHITLVWLPTGIAVAALLRWGWAVWPGVYLAALAVNLSIGSSWPLAAGIAVGNTLGPMICVGLLKRDGFDSAFASQRDIASFIAMAGSGMIVSASGGVANLYEAGAVPLQGLGSAWLAWWMGDTVGVLLATPLLLSWTRDNVKQLRRDGSEFLLWCLAAGTVAWFAFMHDYAQAGRALPLAFLTLPLIAWAALRLGGIAAALAGLGFSVVAAWGTGSGHGTFSLPSSHIGMFLLWSYMAVSVLTGLMITALQDRQFKAEATLRLSEDRLNDAQRVARLGNFDWNLVTGSMWWSDQHVRLWGLEPHGLVPSYEMFLQGVHPDDVAAVRGLVQQSLSDHRPFECEYRVVWSDGSVHDIRSEGRVVLDAEGQAARLIGTAQEITEHKRATAELRRSETKFRTLYDSISDAVLLLGDNRILECNQAALDLFGAKTKPEFCALRPTEHLSPPTQPNGEESKALAEANLSNALKTGQLRVEWMCRRVDTGTPFPAEVQLSAMDLDGLPVVQAVVRDLTERKQAEEKIRYLAFYDELTKLPNRRLMMDRLGQALVTSQRTREFGAVLMLDLDNFKYLNDTQGHDAGDRLLSEVAHRVLHVVRQEDTVSRLGGDEYVVLMEGLGEDEATAATHAEVVAEKIRGVFNEAFAVTVNARAFRTTCSLGVTLFRGQDVLIDELLKQADVALYQAKGAGRNSVRFFNPQMQAVIESHSAMEAALHHGLQHNELRLFYQPQLNHEGQLIGAEALLRWYPAGQKPVSPAQFIPLAEETGLIIPIGLWVLETACAQIQAWSAQPQTRNLVIAINVSARQFRQPDFVKLVRETLLRFEVDPALLKLELTESVVLENVDEVIERMLEIKALGVTFALDDFGTGFSSLSYLKRLPLDQVKVDQSFVRDVTTDPNDAAIVRAIIAMSLSLGMQVVAEGVETRSQLEFLSDNGCKHYQGYLFGKPAPIEEWPALLQADFKAQFVGGT